MTVTQGLSQNNENSTKKPPLWNHSDSLLGVSIKSLAACVSLLDSVLAYSIWPPAGLLDLPWDKQLLGFHI